MSEDIKAAEQEARDLLEVMEIDNAQDFSAGELVELTNLIVDRYKWRLLAVRQAERIRELEEAFDLLRRVSLPPVDVSGTQMWDAACRMRSPELVEKTWQQEGGGE